MQIGYYMPEGVPTHKYAVIDDICVVRTQETKLDNKVSVSGSAAEAQAGSFEIKIDGKLEREAYLKISFANTTQKTIDAKFTVNGTEYGTVPFYKTGERTDVDGLDCVYVPLVLLDQSSTLSFTMTGAKDSLYILGAEIVEKSDRFN